MSLKKSLKDNIPLRIGFIAIFVISLIAGALYSVFKYYETRSRPGSDAFDLTQNEHSGYTYSETLTLDEIIQRSTDAMGSRTAWSDVRTLRFNGGELQGTTSMEFTRLQKRPNMIRTYYEHNKRAVVVGYNGFKSWQAHMSLNGKYAKSEISAQNAREIVAQARLEPLFYIYFEKPELFYREVNSTNEGNPVFCVRYQPDKDTLHRFYFDTKSYLLVKWTTDYPTTPNNISNATIYGEYERMNDIAFPRKVMYYLNNQLVSTQSVRSIEVNPSLHDFLFQPPVYDK
jgi:hypothetical protein